MEGLLKNLQSSFLETLKILQPWYQWLQCPMERRAERMPGTPSSHQRLEGGQGLHTGKFISEREASEEAGGREEEREAKQRGRGKGKQRHGRWESKRKRQDAEQGWGSRERKGCQRGRNERRNRREK